MDTCQLNWLAKRNARWAAPNADDCWCHSTFTNPDEPIATTLEALRAEIRRLNLESRIILAMRKNRQLN